MPSTRFVLNASAFGLAVSMHAACAAYTIGKLNPSGLIDVLFLLAMYLSTPALLIAFRTTRSRILGSYLSFTLFILINCIVCSAFWLSSTPVGGRAPVVGVLVAPFAALVVEMIVVLVAFRESDTASRRGLENQCQKCGYSMTGLRDYNCPECGYPDAHEHNDGWH